MSGDQSYRPVTDTPTTDAPATASAAGLASQDLYGNQALAQAAGISGGSSDWGDWLSDIQRAAQQTLPDSPIEDATLQIENAGIDDVRARLEQKQARQAQAAAELEQQRLSDAITTEDYYIQATALDQQAETLKTDLEGLTEDNAAEIGHKHSAADSTVTSGVWEGSRVGLRDTTTNADGTSATATTTFDLNSPGIHHSGSATSADGTTLTAGGGFGVVNEGGVTGLRGSTHVSQADKDGSSTAASQSTTLTGQGIATNQSLERKGAAHKGKHLTTQGFAKVSSSGSFKVFVVPSTEHGEPIYTLTTQLSGKIAGTLGGTAKGRVSLSGSATGALSGSLTFTHRLSDAEVAAYGSALDDIEAGTPRTDTPEFSLISAMLAQLANADDAAAGAAALVSSSLAADLNEGDTVSLTLSGSASGEIGASVSGVGGKASGSVSRTRTVTVERGKDRHGAPVVQVTVAFDDAQSGTLANTLGIDEASAAAQRTGSRSQGRTEVVYLDPDAPDYDATYDALLRTTSPAELTALVDTLSDNQRGSRTTRTGTGHTDSISAESDGVKVESNATAKGSEAVTEDGGEWHAEASQRSGYGGSVTFGGEGVAGGGRTGIATSTVKNDGETHLRLTDSQETTQASMASSESAFLSHGATKAILDTITETETRLLSYDLSHNQINLLILRAQNEAGWLTAFEGFAPQNHLPHWMSLRELLLSPELPSEFPDAPYEFLIQLGRMRALLGYCKVAGPDGTTVLGNVLRHWQEDALNHYEGAEDIGLMVSFPPEIAEHAPAFHALREEMDEAIGPVGTPVCLPDDGDLLTSFADRLTVIETAIAGCTTFDSPRAQMEMLDVISAMHEKLHLARLARNDIEVTDPSGDMNMELHVREVRRLEAQMAQFKTREDALFIEFKTIVDQQGSLSSSAWEVADQSGGVLGRIRDLHEFWMSQIDELRTAYRRAENMAYMQYGTCNPEGSVMPWLVSDQGKARNPETEPDGERYLQLLTDWRFGGSGLSREDKELLNRYQQY